MTDALDPTLGRDLAALAPPGLLIGHRLILPGDEDTLQPDEAASMASAAMARRRASGAARVVARELLAQLGHGGVAIPRGASGAPLWPAGVVGSMAHDDRVAVAAVGLVRDIAAVGIDVEPAQPLPPDMLELVTTPNERQTIANDPLQGRLLFAAKEAVYKAAYPLDGVFLEFRDIDVDFAGAKAVTQTGRTFALRTCNSSHVVVLALA